MTSRWIIIALAGAALVGVEPVLAQSRDNAPPRCDPRPMQFSWSGFWFNPRPQPNGCAPPVFVGGHYVGQDPDPRIRHELRRDPSTGYAYELAQ